MKARAQFDSSFVSKAQARLLGNFSNSSSINEFRAWAYLLNKLAFRLGLKPYGLFSTIQDCIGASIAWPYPFISVVHED
ncbi:hypothetical protein HanPSC8_Chr02g0073261 [Helianthus annuus]|uniref:Uncharacterized protein n=1 Tax=Helianthus annuus TaxID=4232 RepID=A0A251SVQ8_HELAN|nr:hypothetical protein HanPSC8_Chr02g0073261 [Helianthus annuus]